MRLSRRQFIAGAAGLSVSGCVSVPTPASVSSAAMSVGGSAGLVLSECKLSDDAESAIIRLVTHVVTVVPDVGQDRETLWMDMARRHISGLIQRGKMKSTIGCIVLLSFGIILRAFTILERRYPEIRTVREFMDAAIDGFGKGFIAAFRTDASSDMLDVDASAYVELRDGPDILFVRELSSSVL